MEATNDQELSHAKYWDERYSQSDGSVPTHEWFRSFSTLEPFFASNLIDSEGFTPQDEPFILHLGSGDSVCEVHFTSLGALMIYIYMHIYVRSELTPGYLFHAPRRSLLSLLPGDTDVSSASTFPRPLCNLWKTGTPSTASNGG